MGISVRVMVMEEVGGFIVVVVLTSSYNLRISHTLQPLLAVLLNLQFSSFLLFLVLGHVVTAYELIWDFSLLWWWY